MVQTRFEPRKLESGANKETSNCAPRSIIMLEGTTKPDSYLEINARATVSAVISDSGSASGHRAIRSMHASGQGKPAEMGSGPTRSKRM